MSADLLARGLAARAAARLASARADAPIYNRAGLAAWHAALAARALAPARVLAMGDSITEGYAAPLGSRYVDRLLARLRADHPVAGVAGAAANYLPAYYIMGSAGGPLYPPATPLTANAFGQDNGWGPGGRSAVLNNDGDGFTFQFTGTSFQALYIKYTTFGSISIAIDGGTPVVFSTAGSAGPARWASPVLAAGAHTVVVKRAGGAAVDFSGLYLFNGDEAAGVQLIEAGHGGWATPDYLATQLTQFDTAAIAPQLALIALGTNDYKNQLPIATYRANLQTLVARLRAAAPGLSVALLAMGARGDLAAQPIGWAQYVGACFDVADADAGGIYGGSGVAVIDLSARLPWAATSGTPDPLGLYHTDRVHLSPKGHAVVGEMAARALAL